MIEYLKQLMERQLWKDALSYADGLTQSGNLTSEDVVIVYCAILRGRIALGEYDGAIHAGELAVSLAAQAEDWDAYGTAYNDLGVAYFMLKRHEQSIRCFKAYIDECAKYNGATRLQSTVWFNLSCVFGAEGNGPEAIHALTQALETAPLSDDPQRTQSLMLSLINAYLRAGQTGPVPRLLAKSAHHLRSSGVVNRERSLYLALYRAEFALLTGRLRRARLLAVRGLVVSGEAYRHKFEFHMLLAEIEKKRDVKSFALEHAISARIYAVGCQRPDLEALAVSVLEQLTA